MHYQYATLTICNVMPPNPPLHPARYTWPAEVGPSPPLPLTKNGIYRCCYRAGTVASTDDRASKRDAGPGPRALSGMLALCLSTANNPNYHQTEESGGFGTFSATLPSLGFEPTSAGRKKGTLPTVLRQDTMPGHGAFLTLCPSTALMQPQ